MTPTSKSKRFAYPHHTTYYASSNTVLPTMKLTKSRQRPQRAQMITARRAGCPPSQLIYGGVPGSVVILGGAISPQRMRHQDILRQTGQYIRRNIPMVRLSMGYQSTGSHAGQSLMIFMVHLVYFRDFHLGTEQITVDGPCILIILLLIYLGSDGIFQGALGGDM